MTRKHHVNGDETTILPQIPEGEDAPRILRAGTGPLDLDALSIPVQDLTRDPLLAATRRMPFFGRSVPSLGGVPLLAKIGQGGMGAVYFGVHPRLKQEVAVKVLPFARAESSPDLVHRFFREAQMAVRVDSPNIVRVLDVNEEQNIFFLVMEYVSGPSAGAYLREVRGSGGDGLEEPLALDVSIAASIGLAAAHTRDVVHRDIKPDNIMIPRRSGAMLFEAARLADLGLGRCEALGRSLTGANASLGTPGFMPPEQATDAKTVRKSADVFGMGATLYALLCGKAPFQGSSPMEAIFNTVQTPHAPISSVCPMVSRPTAELIEICLNKTPHERFADGNVLVDALKICRQYIGQPERAQAEAVQQLKQLKKVREASPSTRYTSSVIARHTHRKFRNCVLGKACLAIMLLGSASGFFLWRENAFTQSRENVLRHAACNCSQSVDDVGCGIGILEAFVRENSSRTPEELADVTERLGLLRSRRTQLADRRRQFEQLLDESEQQAEKNPETALLALEQAAKLGVAEGDLPDLLATAVPKLDERRKRVQAAQSTLAEQTKQRHDTAARESFMQAFTAAQEAARIPDWSAVQTSLECGFSTLGDLEHPARAAANALLAQAKGALERQSPATSQRDDSSTLLRADQRL